MSSRSRSSIIGSQPSTLASRRASRFDALIQRTSDGFEPGPVRRQSGVAAVPHGRGCIRDVQHLPRGSRNQRSKLNGRGRPPNFVAWFAVGRFVKIPQQPGYSHRSQSGPGAAGAQDLDRAVQVSTSTVDDVRCARFDQAGRGTVEGLPQRP